MSKDEKEPNIKSPLRKTWPPAHGSTTTLASQLSNVSSRSSLSGFTAATGPKFARSATSQRLRPRTIANPPTEAGKLHKLGSMPAYLRRNRPASSPAEVESKLEQLDSGVGGDQLDFELKVAAGRPEGSTEVELNCEPLVEEVKKEDPKVFIEPKTIPIKRPKILATKAPVKLEQNEAFQKLTSRVEELEAELAQKNVEYATLAQSNATLTQDNASMASRVEALEKLLKPPQEAPSREGTETRNFREAMQANVRKQDEALVGLRDMLLNSVVGNGHTGRPAKLDEAKLRVLMKQVQESTQEMRELVKNNRELSEEIIGQNGIALAEANMRSMMDHGLGEIITARIVYD